MAIYTERVIRVNNNKATMDSDIFIFRGNRNIEIQFKIMDHQFKFKDTNMVERFSPSHAYVTLLTPQMKQVGTGKGEVIEGVIKLVVSSAMIDEKTECGDYTIVIDLYDEEGDSVLTIPPVEGQLHVLDRVTEIDDIPDELRFQFDENTGDLDVIEIDVTYDGNGEIRTIKGIPLADTKGRRDMERLKEDMVAVEELVQPMSANLNQAMGDIARLDPIVQTLVDSGYHQIRAGMTQEEIQNELNKGGLILWRTGSYTIAGDGLTLVSNTVIIIEGEVTLNAEGASGAIMLNSINNVMIEGNLIITKSYLRVTSCMDIVINNICVKETTGNAIAINGGDNVVLNNVVTESSGGAGIYVTNTTNAANIVINNHTDIQSYRAVAISTNSENALSGRIHFNNSLYVPADNEQPCIMLDNSINSYKVIFDKPSFNVAFNKNEIIQIRKTDGTNSQKLGNIEINDPHVTGDGVITNFINIKNTPNPGNIEKIKIDISELDLDCSSMIKLYDDVSSRKSIKLELSDNCEKEVLANVNLIDDLRCSYVLPSSASSNVTINLAGVPVNQICEFTNKSTFYSLLLSGPTINGNTDLLELKYNDYVKLKHVGSGVWIVLDENFKNKIMTISPGAGALRIPNARYLFATITEETELILPTTQATFTEIHLFIVVTDDGGLIYPENILWTQDEPELMSDCVFEFIFTRVNNKWLIGCVSYV